MSSEPWSDSPKITNSRIASALLALAAEEPGGRAATEYRAAARTLRGLGTDLYGRRFALASLPGVSLRAADAIGSFLACGSDENIDDALASMLDRADPAAGRKARFPLARGRRPDSLRARRDLPGGSGRRPSPPHRPLRRPDAPRLASSRPRAPGGPLCASHGPCARLRRRGRSFSRRLPRAAARGRSPERSSRLGIHDVPRRGGEHRRGRDARRDAPERARSLGRRRVRAHGSPEPARPDGAPRARRRDARRRDPGPPEGTSLRHAERRPRGLAARLRGRRGTRSGHRAERLPGTARPPARARGVSPSTRAASSRFPRTRTRRRTSRSSTSASPWRASRAFPPPAS